MALKNVFLTLTLKNNQDSAIIISMNNKFEEKTLDSEAVYKGRVFSVKKDNVVLSDGYKTTREVAMHNGGVVIVAQQDGKIILVRQYRYAVQEMLLELPAGRLEQGEDTFDCAKRELAEETGYRAGQWKSLGFIITSPGFSNEKLYLYHASDLEFVKQNPDEGEIIECEWFPTAEVDKMIKNGQINDAKTICALMRAFKL